VDTNPKEMKEEMTIRLKAKIETNQEKMIAKLDAHHKRMMTKMDYQPEKMEACLERWRPLIWRQIPKKQSPSRNIRESLVKRLQWRLSDHRRTDWRASDRPWYTRTHRKGRSWVILQQEPLKDQESRRDDGRAWNVKMA
jgi:hypothetical protein